METSLPAISRHRPQAVAIFMFDFARTGVVANAVRIANALVARDCRVTLLVCSDEGRAKHALDPAVRVVRAGSFIHSSLPRAPAMLAGLPALRRALRQVAPDVLLSAGNHAHGFALAASAGMPAMRRVLRISNELRHLGKGPLARLGRRLAHRLLLGLADRLLLVSEHLARDPLLAGAIADGRAVCTPNGVAADDVRRRAAAPCSHAWMEESTPVVIAVGRLARHKNFDTLIRAFARAVAVRPMRLVIVGGGPVAERQRLLQLAADLGIAEAMRLEGEIANPMPLLARAATFVLPSLWEGSSNALLEAVACGVPVVAALSAGNAQQVLGYGRFGLLVDPLDVPGMAQAILYQTSADPCRPGDRAADYPAAAAVARVCEALKDIPRRGVAAQAATMPENAGA